MNDANDRFEAAARRFYKDTGVVAPGKDNPFVLDIYDLRVKLFAEWRARKLVEAERDKLLEVVGVNCCHCGQTTYHQPALLKEVGSE